MSKIMEIGSVIILKIYAVAYTFLAHPVVSLATGNQNMENEIDIIFFIFHFPLSVCKNDKCNMNFSSH